MNTGRLIYFALAFLSLVIKALAIQGCNGHYGEDHGIPCCGTEFTPGEIDNGDNEKFIQEGEYQNSCIESCKSLHPTSIGVTESVKQKYSGGNGMNKNKCWCEFGDAILDDTKQDFQTCVFAIPEAQALIKKDTELENLARKLIKVHDNDENGKLNLEEFFEFTKIWIEHLDRDGTAKFLFFLDQDVDKEINLNELFILLKSNAQFFGH